MDQRVVTVFTRMMSELKRPTVMVLIRNSGGERFFVDLQFKRQTVDREWRVIGILNAEVQVEESARKASSPWV